MGENNNGYFPIGVVVFDDLLSKIIAAFAAVLVAAGTSYFTTQIKFRSEKRKLAEDWRAKVLEKYYGEFGDFQKLAQQFAVGVVFFEDQTREGHHQKIFIPKDFNLTIGRNEDNDIVSNDMTVSRIHAVLSADSSSVYIEDIFPTNPSKINGNEVSGRTKLSDNDEILIGSTKMKFKRVSGWRA